MWGKASQKKMYCMGLHSANTGPWKPKQSNSCGHQNPFQHGIINHLILCTTGKGSAITAEEKWVRAYSKYKGAEQQVSLTSSCSLNKHSPAAPQSRKAMCKWSLQSGNRLLGLVNACSRREWAEVWPARSATWQNIWIPTIPKAQRTDWIIQITGCFLKFSLHITLEPQLT